jgi:hypothetical protein
MAPMPEPADAHHELRRRLLAGVSTRLRELGIEDTFGPLQPYYDLYGSTPDGVTGLIVRQPGDGGRMQVTVVSVRATGGDGLSPDGHTWSRDLDIEYDLEDDSGDGPDRSLAFEVTTLEGHGDGPGTPPAVWAPRRLVREEQAVLDAIRLWHGYRDSLRSVLPTPDPGRRTRLARQIAARQAAATAARVRPEADDSAVLPQQRPALAADLARVDGAQLCYHFPRDRNGRYARAAVVALAGYGPDLRKRGPWLTARAGGDTLVLAVEALIGANQDHRWDASPWLWSAEHASATAEQRWQVPDAEHARPIVALLDRQAPADALTMCGVDVDDDLAALLAGYPISYRYAQYTDTWVARLYEQLQLCAPWRLAAAYRTWQESRPPRRRPVDEPIVLFGLKGLNQQSRPTVALELRDGVPRLAMVWTANNARLPRTLWERPADLEAALLAADYVP